jgi:MFS family permease
LGAAYLPAAASGIFFVYNGTHRGVLISAGYLGLAASFAVGAILAATLALYVVGARRSALSTVVPPNTLFEDETHRSRLFSWGTVLVFALAVSVGLSCFGNRYADSRIHLWDSPTPISDSFFESRSKAFAAGCPKGPCFSMGQRMEGKKAADHVVEYVLYWTDGLLIFLFFCLLAALAYLIHAWRKRYEPPRYVL